MDFENFCNSYVEKDEKDTKTEQQKNQKKVQTNSVYEDDIKKKIDKYKNYSNQELLTELLTEANKQKKNGNLTNEKIEEMVSGLSPYLDNEQKQRLNEIIKLLR